MFGLPIKPNGKLLETRGASMLKGEMGSDIAIYV